MRYIAECCTCSWSFASPVEHRVADRADRHEAENPDHKVEIEEEPS